MLKKITIAALGAAALLTTHFAQAEEFPERTIEVVFPWTPGVSMSVSQIIAEKMSEELGVSITVVSTPGAAGIKALKTTMSRPADGYSIMDGYVAPLVLQPVLGNGDWTFADYAPLHSTISAPFSIGIRASDDRWKTFDEMMAWGKEHPGELRYSAGVRNALPHMVIAKVLKEYGVVAQNIPYGGDAEARKDLKSGILDFAFVNVGAFRQEPDSFKIMLVLSELNDAKAAYGWAPNIADLDLDLELTGLAPMGWSWWVVHKDTPAEKLNILRKAMRRAMSDPDVRRSIEKLGLVPLDWNYDKYEEIVGPVFEQLKSMGEALTWEEEELNKLN